MNDPNDPRRINQLWVNDGNGGWTRRRSSAGWSLRAKLDDGLADIDNDGDFDCLATNHSSTIKLLENDGTGYFTDITGAAAWKWGSSFSKMDDFDNDGLWT